MIRRAAGVVTLFCLGACRQAPAPEASASASPGAARSVVVYSSTDKEFAPVSVQAAGYVNRFWCKVTG